MGIAAGLARAGARVEVLFPWGPSLPSRRFTHRGVVCEPHFLATNALLSVPDAWLPSAVAHSFQPPWVGVRRVLRRALDHDVVQFELCAYPGWMERLRGATRPPRLAYSAHNVEQDLFRGRPGPGGLRRPMLARIESLERRTVAASDLLVTCTASDADRMRELYGSVGAGVVVPNGFDDALASAREPSMRKTAREELGIGADEVVLVFVGGRAHHNLQAVEFLERVVLPELRDGTRLLVVGRCAEARGNPDLPRGAVIRLGHVPDLALPLAAADVGVNPVAYGSGSNVKVAEYLAAALPVVSTPVGARGYEDGVLLAEPQGFAAAVRAAAGERRAELDRERSWSALGDRLLRAYERLS